ncbi:hypothetical protein CDAR_210251 [Caerostris darwini]|uniref:Uncharacterized protein n=1 Tax=Caerostris darwini TaxID=1538125 RepID=A0AAV4TRT6_9ARAC|nr:hypothetical protein CDAR_210251 [Caerostris darwini]
MHRTALSSHNFHCADTHKRTNSITGRRSLLARVILQWRPIASSENEEAFITPPIQAVDIHSPLEKLIKIFLMGLKRVFSVKVQDSSIL